MPRSKAPSPAPTLRCVLRPERDRVVVAVFGELDVATVDDVDAHLRDVREVGFDHVVLDLSDLVFMASVGVRLLVRWTERAAEDGWRLDVVGDHGAVERIIDLAGVRALL